MTLINDIASFIIFVFCCWCVLDLRVHTRLAGTVALSFVGLCALLNIGRPDYAAMVPENYATLFTVSLAIGAVWFWWRWEDPRTEHRDFWDAS